MKYVLLLDKNEEPLVCELQHHIECHNGLGFEPVSVFDATSYEDAYQKTDKILDELDNKPRQMNLLFTL